MGLLRLFTNTKGVVSVKDFLCSFSDSEKDQQDTTFIYEFLYCDMDKGIIMDVIVTGIIAETTAKTTYNICEAVNIFVGEEAGQLFEEVLHINPTCLFNVTQLYT